VKHGSKERSIDTTTFQVAAKARDLFGIKDTSWAKRIRFVLTTILLKVFSFPIQSANGSKPVTHSLFMDFAAKMMVQRSGSPFAAVKPSTVKCAPGSEAFHQQSTDRFDLRFVRLWLARYYYQLHLQKLDDQGESVQTHSCTQMLAPIPQPLLHCYLSIVHLDVYR
jgi:hypothetical protein